MPPNAAAPYVHGIHLVGTVVRAQRLHAKTMEGGPGGLVGLGVQDWTGE
jgi:hypothetical protein